MNIMNFQYLVRLTIASKSGLYKITAHQIQISNTGKGNHKIKISHTTQLQQYQQRRERDAT